MFKKLSFHNYWLILLLSNYFDVKMEINLKILINFIHGTNMGGLTLYGRGIHAFANF